VSEKSAACGLSHVLYCETKQQKKTTKKKLRRTIQNKRRGMLTSGVVLLPDSALPHTAARTRALLEYFSWELFDHSPYSHDLAPSDYHLFTFLKNWLGSQRVDNK
jgi:histone-lysine N-methyltransferase SETMAR